MRGINVHDFEECPRRGFRTLTAKPNIVISDPSLLWLKRKSKDILEKLKNRTNQVRALEPNTKTL